LFPSAVMGYYGHFLFKASKEHWDDIISEWQDEMADSDWQASPCVVWGLDVNLLCVQLLCLLLTYIKHMISEIK
jgi:hypothetical protein